VWSLGSASIPSSRNCMYLGTLSSLYSPRQPLKGVRLTNSLSEAGNPSCESSKALLEPAQKAQTLNICNPDDQQPGMDVNTNMYHLRTSASHGSDSLTGTKARLGDAAAPGCTQGPLAFSLMFRNVRRKPKSARLYRSSVKVLPFFLFKSCIPTPPHAYLPIINLPIFVR
jgi:hypothetical protein